MKNKYDFQEFLEYVERAVERAEEAGSGYEDSHIDGLETEVMLLHKAIANNLYEGIELDFSLAFE